MLYRQPQHGSFEIDRAGNGARLFFAAIPALSLRNLSTGRAFTIVSPATGNQVSNGPNGLDLMIHPAGGTNGYGGLRASDLPGSSDDWTLIWIGRPQNYSTGNGKLMARGADSAGNGWNIQFGYSGGPTSGSGTGSLVASVVDTSPAAFSVTLSGISMTVDQHERVAMVKRGNTIKVFNWRTRQMASASAGNGALRTSTLGIALGLDTGNDVTTAGHNKVNTALGYDFGMPDSEVWTTLDNPWEDFEPDGSVLRAVGGASPDVTVAVTGQVATVSAGTLRASTAKALTGQVATSARGTLSVAVSKALTGQFGTVSPGTLVPSTAITLVGASATAQQGNVSSDSNVTVALSGQVISALLGTMAISSTTALSGSAAGISQGTVVAGISQPLTGVAIATARGDVSPATSTALLGQGSATAQGTMGVVGDVTVALIGQSMAAYQGILRIAQIDAANASGGFYEVPRVGRHRSVKEERERLGIIPKAVKAVIVAAAAESVTKEATDTQAKGLLARALDAHDIAPAADYTQLMQQERDRILMRDIGRALRIRQRQHEIDEDEREVEMLLM